MNNFDQSHKDSKYFIDGYIYNCPFCNRGHVKYKISDTFRFWWTRERMCYGYIVKCDDCAYESLHLSNYQLEINYGHFSYPLKYGHKVRDAFGELVLTDSPLKNDDDSPMELDNAFFHSQPTSFFTIDNRIPEKIRKPLNEADNCRSNNFLTGGSACLRRSIYELLQHQKIEKTDDKGKRIDYDDRIKRLKNKLPAIDSEYFDILKIIKGVASEELHENPWQEFTNAKLLLLIESTKEILYRIYVEPDEKKKKKSAILKLHEKATGKTETKKVESK